MRLRRAAPLALLCAAFVAAACRGPADVRYQEAVEEAPAPAVHAVHSERLQTVMRGLRRLRDERLPVTLDLAVERERRLRRVSEVAEAMAESADRIGAAAPELGLEGKRREEFLGLADTLARRARELARTAPSLGPEELRDRVAAIEATCSACHERFRPE